MRKINKRVLDTLIKSGAMDVLGGNRAALVNAVDHAIKAADQHKQDRQAGQFDMFGIQEALPKQTESARIPDWSDEQRLAAEKETLGLYLTGHPYQRYARELDPISDRDAPSRDFGSLGNGVFAGIMMSMRTRRGKMAFVVLDNEMHRVEVTLFPEKFNQCSAILQKENLLIAFGQFSVDEVTGGCQMRVEKICDLDELRRQYLIRLDLNLSQDALTPDRIGDLQAVMSPYCAGNGAGSVAVKICYTRSSGESGFLNLGDSWKVKPEQKLFMELENQFGAGNISCHYDLYLRDQFLSGNPDTGQNANARSI